MISGRFGIIKNLVNHTAIIEGIPKIKVTFHSISVSCFIAPIIEEIPTVNKEYAVATFSSREKIYAKTGTANNDPPPPKIPKKKPIMTANTYPKNSINLY
jgi:hypothetical protein